MNVLNEIIPTGGTRRKVGGMILEESLQGGTNLSHCTHWPSVTQVFLHPMPASYRSSEEWTLPRHNHFAQKRSFSLRRVTLKLTGGHIYFLSQPGLLAMPTGPTQSPGPAVRAHPVRTAIKWGKWTSDPQLLQETEGMKAKCAKIYPNIWPFTLSKSTTWKHSSLFIFGWRHQGMERRRQKVCT